MGPYSQYWNATISYSDIQGGLISTGFTDGGNNITDDPGFAAGEYHLPLESPCIDKAILFGGRRVMALLIFPRPSPATLGTRD